jgi:hypothetical protein
MTGINLVVLRFWFTAEHDILRIMNDLTPTPLQGRGALERI